VNRAFAEAESQQSRIVAKNSSGKRSKNEAEKPNPSGQPADGDPAAADAPRTPKSRKSRTYEGVLSFERPILEMEDKIDELKSLASSTHLNLNGEVVALEERLRKVTTDIYGQLTPWERVNVARHPERPIAADYIETMLDDFVELHGDRLFADDGAIVTGLARMSRTGADGGSDSVNFLLIAHRKGKTVQERLLCNFGCAHPEGYRKALEKMHLAERMGLPIVTLINTPGAYPGIGAEERGQARAIAHNIREMFSIRVPILSIVIGEGGSGGALGIGVGDRVGMLEQSYYSVISPEGCAAILYKNADKAPEAAAALKLTAPDLVALGIIDDVISEPLGGAHRSPGAAIHNVREWIFDSLKGIREKSLDDLLAARHDKFRHMGEVREGADEPEAEDADTKAEPGESDDAGPDPEPDAAS